MAAIGRSGDQILTLAAAALSAVGVNLASRLCDRTLFRKRPKIHKAMMLLASLSILAGATVRMPACVGSARDRRWFAGEVWGAAAASATEPDEGFFGNGTR